jgi:hypothetical protein
MDLKDRKMMTQTHNPMHRNSAKLAALALMLFCASGFAQVSSYGDKATGENTGDQLPCSTRCRSRSA